MNQGIGYLIAGTVVIICSKIWEGHEGARDYLWRTCLVRILSRPLQVYYYTSSHLTYSCQCAQPSFLLLLLVGS